MTRVLSRHHPGTTPPSAVLLRAQSGPVGIAFAVLMVITVVAMLQGTPVLRAFLIALPLVYLGAAAWALYDLRRRPAEVLLSDGFGIVRSVWDVATEKAGRTALPFVPVLHPRKGDGALLVGFGDTVFAFRPDDWPDFDDLRDALTASADVTEGRYVFAGP